MGQSAGAHLLAMALIRRATGSEVSTWLDSPKVWHSIQSAGLKEGQGQGAAWNPLEAQGRACVSVFTEAAHSTLSRSSHFT